MARKIKDASSMLRDLKRKTRRKFPQQKKIRIVLEGLTDEDSIGAFTTFMAQTLYDHQSNRTK